MPTVRSAICLHAKADDLTFLNGVKNRMGKVLGSKIKEFNLKDPASHDTALLALRTASEGFVTIFAHGTGDHVHGGEYMQMGEPRRRDKFIARSDLDLFRGKVVYCMSCDSNGLAHDSLEAGALAFVGFDSIPFTHFDPITEESIGSHALMKHCKELIAGATKATLERFISGRSTLDEAVDYLRLWISKEAISYVRSQTGDQERREVAALFLRVKDGVRYHGPLGIRFE